MLDVHNSPIQQHLSNSVNSVASKSEDLEIDGDLQERMLIDVEVKDVENAEMKDKHATLKLK